MITVIVVELENKPQEVESCIAMNKTRDRLMLLNPSSNELMIINLVEEEAKSIMILPKAHDFASMFVFFTDKDGNDIIKGNSVSFTVTEVAKVLPHKFQKSWIKVINFLNKK